MDNHEKLIAMLFQFCTKMSCYGTVSSRAGGMIISFKCFSDLHSGEAALQEELFLTFLKFKTCQKFVNEVFI